MCNNNKLDLDVRGILSQERLPLCAGQWFHLNFLPLETFGLCSFCIRYSREFNRATVFMIHFLFDLVLTSFSLQTQR